MNSNSSISVILNFQPKRLAITMLNNLINVHNWQLGVQRLRQGDSRGTKRYFECFYGAVENETNIYNMYIYSRQLLTYLNSLHTDWFLICNSKTKECITIFFCWYLSIDCTKCPRWVLNCSRVEVVRAGAIVSWLTFPTFQRFG